MNPLHNQSSLFSKNTTIIIYKNQWSPNTLPANPVDDKPKYKPYITFCVKITPLLLMKCPHHTYPTILE